MRSIAEILRKRSFAADYRNKYEFQAYGNRLAEELNDTKHRSLYIKMARDENRNLLEAARLYALGAEKVAEKGRLFMWKLSQLKNGKQVEDKI